MELSPGGVAIAVALITAISAIGGYAINAFVTRKIGEASSLATFNAQLIETNQDLRTEVHILKRELGDLVVEVRGMQRDLLECHAAESLLKAEVERMLRHLDIDGIVDEVIDDVE